MAGGGGAGEASGGNSDVMGGRCALSDFGGDRGALKTLIMTKGTTASATRHSRDSQRGTPGIGPTATHENTNSSSSAPTVRTLDQSPGSSGMVIFSPRGSSASMEPTSRII